MTDDLEQKFVQIAERAIHEAERIECSLDDFTEGLQTIYFELKARHELAVDEAEHP